MAVKEAKGTEKERNILEARMVEQIIMSHRIARTSRNATQSVTELRNISKPSTTRISTKLVAEN